MAFLFFAGVSAPILVWYYRKINASTAKLIATILVLFIVIYLRWGIYFPLFSPCCLLPLISFDFYFLNSFSTILDKHPLYTNSVVWTILAKKNGIGRTVTIYSKNGNIKKKKRQFSIFAQNITWIKSFFSPCRSSGLLIQNCAPPYPQIVCIEIQYKHKCKYLKRIRFPFVVRANLNSNLIPFNIVLSYFKLFCSLSP